jgi:hypothetical protein
MSTDRRRRAWDEPGSLVLAGTGNTITAEHSVAVGHSLVIEEVGVMHIRVQLIAKTVAEAFGELNLMNTMDVFRGEAWVATPDVELNETILGLGATKGEAIRHGQIQVLRAILRHLERSQEPH